MKAHCLIVHITGDSITTGITSRMPSQVSIMQCSQGVTKSDSTLPRSSRGVQAEAARAHATGARGLHITEEELLPCTSAGTGGAVRVMHQHQHDLTGIFSAHIYSAGEPEEADL